MAATYSHVSKVVFRCPAKKTGNMVIDVGTIELTQPGMLQVLNRWISWVMSDSVVYRQGILDLGDRLAVAGYTPEHINVDNYESAMTVILAQHHDTYRWLEALLDPIFTEWLEQVSGEDVYVHVPDPLMAVLGEPEPAPAYTEQIRVKTVEI